MENKVIDIFENGIRLISELEIDEKIVILNKVRGMLHEISPFKDNPVDFVKWIRNDKVRQNDYNPNVVAPPEMELLKKSISEDGYTQPIVTMPDESLYEVVDGFHRHRVGKEDKEINRLIHGYLPVVEIRSKQYDKSNRIAATIRHNRARGKHQIDAMSDIVIELKRRNWTNQRIMRELGMDEDEVLRLCQITGLAELFSDQQFSAAWDVESGVTESDFEELSDDIDGIASVAGDSKIPNVSDKDRVFHTYDKWECYKAGFYNTTVSDMTTDEAENLYKEFLSDSEKFSKALESVITEWKNSCEHYLTNSAMNRIAWLGQAAACYSLGLPSRYRGGFYLLTEDKQLEANRIALKYLNKWLVKNNFNEINMEKATSFGRQSDIY